MSFGTVLLMLIGLLGSLGIFMFGMKSLSDGLEKTAGSKLKGLLQKLTGNRFLSVLCGIAITILVQSSTATTVMVVGFVNADLLTLTQAIGVIMGANIGTTVTPLLLSLEGLDFGMLFAFAGLILSWLPDKKSLRRAKEFSPIVMGVGLLFVGMKGMSAATAPLQEWDGFSVAIQSISNPVLGVLTGIVLCIALNSSAACVGLLQALAGQGLIPLSTAIFVLFGTNIGTCLTSLIAGSGTNTTARRTSIMHLLFNTIGTIIFVIIASLIPFADIILSIAPGNLKLQIAMVHIIFNLTTTLILLPGAGLLEKLACLLVRDKGGESAEMRLRFFDTRFLKTPPVAVTQLYRETVRMGEMAVENYGNSLALFNEWDDETAAGILQTEDVLDFLKHEIEARLTDVKGLDLGESDAKLVGALFQAVNDMERVGDHAVNMLEAAQTKKNEEVKFTEKVSAELTDMGNRVTAQLEAAMTLFTAQSGDRQAVADVEAGEETIDNMTEALRAHHVDRLKNKKCSAKNGMLYLDMLTNLERIADHAENIATVFTE
ncbi:MAG: Na/Pi cotransporter family protein [Clostridia bacterium]|nr:Na/Pi cotransporter family protein [Clostridia bacterium]